MGTYKEIMKKKDPVEYLFQLATTHTFNKLTPEIADRLASKLRDKIIQRLKDEPEGSDGLLTFQLALQSILINRLKYWGEMGQTLQLQLQNHPKNGKQFAAFFQVIMRLPYTALPDALNRRVTLTKNRQLLVQGYTGYTRSILLNNIDSTLCNTAKKKVMRLCNNDAFCQKISDLENKALNRYFWEQSNQLSSKGSSAINMQLRQLVNKVHRAPTAKALEKLFVAPQVEAEIVPSTNSMRAN